MGPEEVAREAEELRKKYESLEREKTKVKFSIPKKIRYPLVFTLFFTMIGIMVQSIQAEKLIFISFFTTSYFDWFTSFGSFVSTYETSAKDFLLRIVERWYYFFYTGGLLSMLWAILYTIIHTEVAVEKKDLPI